jgi:hypothetical protein
MNKQIKTVTYLKHLWLFIILAILSFFSLYILLKKWNVTQVLGCYFFSNIMITNTGVIINLNLKLTKQDPTSHLIFWTQKIPELSLKPALLMWFVYFLFSNRSVLSKLTYIFVFLTALMSIEIYFVLIDYLEWVKWNVFYGYLRYFLIIFLLTLYSLFLEKLIYKNKGVITR